MDFPEGAGLQRADRVDFDPCVRPEFRDAQISPDGGLLVMREMDNALGLSGLASAALCDNRRGKNTVHRLDGLFRQSVYGRLSTVEHCDIILLLEHGTLAASGTYEELLSTSEGFQRVAQG